MNVPGMNLLSMAMRVQRRQPAQWQAWLSRSVNDAGDMVSVYAAPVTIQASIHAVNRNTYQLLGLDLQKKYITVYTEADVQTVDRDREGDIITFAGETFSAQSDQDWRPIDGWRKILCVQVPT